MRGFLLLLIANEKLTTYFVILGDFLKVTTFSRLLTAADTQQLQRMIKLDDVKLLSLHQFDTEYSFLKKIRCVNTV